jgi:hypothetical protein
MVRDYFGGKARHSFWSVHVEAWRRSGLTRRKYCFQFSLDQWTFARWLKHLIDKETLKLACCRFSGHHPKLTQPFFQTQPG